MSRQPMPGRSVPLPRSWWNRSSNVVSLRRDPDRALASVTQIGWARAGSRRRVHAASGTPMQEPGFPPKSRAIIITRDPQCVLAGWAGCRVSCAGPLDPHHRDLIGSGGTSHPAKHHPANGVRLCRAHHDFVHSAHRALTRHLGLLVAGGDRFRERPLSFDGGRTWWLITADGRGYTETAPPGGDAA